jgi:hypothetical protein
MPTGFRPFDTGDPWSFGLMQSDMLASLTKRCNIQRKSGAIVNGSPSKAGATYTDLYTNVPCRLRTVRRYPQADVVLIGEQVTQVQPLLLIVPLNTDLKAEDQVVIAGNGYLVLGDESIIATRVALTALVRHVGNVT